MCHRHCFPPPQVWRTPALVHSFAPFQLHRTYAGPYDALTCMDWSPCGKWLLAGGRDTTSRVFSLDPVPGFHPATLSGHRDPLVAVFWAPAGQGSSPGGGTEVGPCPEACYTVSRDGARFGWHRSPVQPSTAGADVSDEDGEEDEAVGAACSSWQLHAKHFFHQAGAKLTVAALHPGSGLLVAGFSTGVFTLHTLPEFSCVHTLSISNTPITSAAFGSDGAWLALGCAQLGQLLVWEWRSETYVLKQQGHYYDVNALAYSPDGASLVTCADDAKVKVWDARAGTCVVTFKAHTAPVAAVCFVPAGQAVLSASLDGTVRAFDLVRYRNFRTMAAPQPCQFVSVACDPSGEVVVAGSSDTFTICVWQLQTGRLLDVLAGHAAPVVSLCFSPVGALLASGSWDKSVRLWDVFESAKGAVEALPHTHDVLAVAFRPDGKQLASSTLDGCIFFWSAQDGVLQGSIEARRDLAGGRAAGDGRSAASSAAGRAFSSLCYSADGALLLAGGNSRFICLYDCHGRTLLQRYQITQSRAVDGVLETLDSRRLTDGGPLDLLPGDASDSEDDLQRRAAARAMPGAGANGRAAGAAAAAGKGAQKRRTARVKCVRLSPSGHGFAAATPEGVLLFSHDTEAAFDPSDLGEDVTPAACFAALSRASFTTAVALALRLNDAQLLRACIERTPPGSVRLTAGAVPEVYLPRLVSALAECLHSSAHTEHLLLWVTALVTCHGTAMQARSAQVVPCARALLRVLATLHEDLAASAGANVHTLRFLCAAPVTAPVGTEAEGDDMDEDAFEP